MSDSCPSLDLDLSSSSQSSLWLVFALTLVTCMIALILTYYYHSHRIFFSSSTLLMTQCIVGGICITCSAAFNIPNTTHAWNSSTCTARVWLFFSGMHLAFSSLCVKLYKLHTIFTNTKITAVHVSDRRMMMYCMIASIPLLMILSIWEIMIPWSAPIPCDTGSGYIMGCHNTQRHIFIPLLLSMTGLLLFTLGYYIYRTYRIPYIYKDTTRILMVLVNTLITFIIGISVYSSFHESNRPIKQIKLIWSVCMLYGVISNIAILYVPMIYQYLHEPISQHLLEKEEEILSQMSPTHQTLRQRHVAGGGRDPSQLPWSHGIRQQPSQQPIHTITHAVEVEQQMAHGNAIDERLATLINKFDADSTRILKLQHEESELLMLAMRKRSEMMSLRQSCLHLRMEIEYLNHHGWNYIQHLQLQQQTLPSLHPANIQNTLELLQQNPQLREQLQYISRHHQALPPPIPSTTLIQTQTTQTRESQYLHSDNGASRNLFHHPVSTNTRVPVVESQHTVASPPPVTMSPVATAPVASTQPSSPISPPTPAPTPVVVHLNDEPTQGGPQFHF